MALILKVAFEKMYTYNTTNTISNKPALFEVENLARLRSWGLDWKLDGNVLFTSEL